jgi:hypothetical protein
VKGRACAPSALMGSGSCGGVVCEEADEEEDEKESVTEMLFFFFFLGLSAQYCSPPLSLIPTSSELHALIPSNTSDLSVSRTNPCSFPGACHHSRSAVVPKVDFIRTLTPPTVAKLLIPVSFAPFALIPSNIIDRYVFNSNPCSFGGACHRK